MIPIILIQITFLYIYERLAIELIHGTKLDYKPFNCVFCLSYWIGLITFLVVISIKGFDFHYIYLLSLPLFYGITQTKLLR
mgnify:CR=1 FL=1